MKIFSHQIIFDGSLVSSNTILLQENISKINTKYTYSLQFYNNQDRELTLTSDNSFETLQKNQNFNFIVHEVVEFSWNFQDQIIYYTLHEKGSMELLRYWLYHTLLPAYFSLRDKIYILHVGAVSYKNTSLVFMANSFGGKSTLTNYFLEKGHKLITDDKLITYKKEDDYLAVPSFPYHRPYRENETLGKYIENFESKELAIKTIYLLKKVEKSEEIILSTLTGIEKIKHLRFCTEIDFSFQFQQNMAYLFEFSKKVQLIQITIPWDLQRLPEVYDTIINHQNSLL